MRPGARGPWEPTRAPLWARPAAGAAGSWDTATDCPQTPWLARPALGLPGRPPARVLAPTTSPAPAHGSRRYTGWGKHPLLRRDEQARPLEVAGSAQGRLRAGSGRAACLLVRQGSLYRTCTHGCRDGWCRRRGRGGLDEEAPAHGRGSPGPSMEGRHGNGCKMSHSVRSREGGKPPRSWAVAPPPGPSHAGGAVWAQRSRSRAAWGSGGSRPSCQAGSPYASYAWAPGAPGSTPEAAGGATAPAAPTASPSPPSCVQPPPKHRQDHHRHHCCHRQDRYRAGHIPAATTTAGATTTPVLRAPTVPLPRHLLQGLRAQDARTGLILMSRETEAGFSDPRDTQPKEDRGSGASRASRRDHGSCTLGPWGPRAWRGLRPCSSRQRPGPPQGRRPQEVPWSHPTSQGSQLPQPSAPTERLQEPPWAGGPVQGLIGASSGGFRATGRDRCVWYLTRIPGCGQQQPSADVGL